MAPLKGTTSNHLESLPSGEKKTFDELQAETGITTGACMNT
jgi:hypothetical protein